MPLAAASIVALCGLLSLPAQAKKWLPACDAAQLKKELEHSGAAYVSVPTASLVAGTADPGTPGGALHRITSGTELSQQCRQGEFVYVKTYAGGPAGWLRDSEVEDGDPEIIRAALRRNFEALPAGNHVERRALAERMVAYSPKSVPLRKQLIDVLRAGGDELALARADAELKKLGAPKVIQELAESQTVFAKWADEIVPLARLSGTEIVGFAYMPGSTAVPPDAPASLFRADRHYHLHTKQYASHVTVWESAYRTASAQHPWLGPDEQAANGIAANYPIGGARPAAPDPDGYATLAELTSVALRDAGIPDKEIIRALAQMRNENLGLQTAVAIQQRGNGRPLLLASVGGVGAVDGGAGNDTFALLLIAEADAAGKYSAVYAQLRRAWRQSDAVYASAFLANADVDGDGQDEILVMNYTAKTSGFQLLQRTSGGWRVVAKAPGSHRLAPGDDP